MNLRKLDKRIVTILLIVFVQMLGAAMVMPILPLYALRRFEMDPIVIPLLGTAFFVAQMIAGPFLGRLSDKYGRVPVLIISQIGTTISFVMIALAPSIEILFLARILDGITGGNIIVAQAYVTDITPPEKRTESLGLIFAAFGLGFIFGPALGGLLSATIGPTAAFLGAAVAAGLVVLLTWRTLDESLTPEQRQANRKKSSKGLNPRHVIANHPLLMILTVTFVAQFVLGLLQATFALYGAAVLFADYSERITDLGIGMLLTVVGVSQFVTQIAILPRLVHRFPDTVIVIIGLIVRGIGTFLFVVIATPLMGAMASMLFAAGMGILMPPLQSMSTRTVGDELRGGVLGLSQSIVSLSTIISTALSGYLFSLNATMPYQFGTVLTLIALVPALLLMRMMPKVVQPASAIATAD